MRRTVVHDFGRWDWDSIPLLTNDEITSFSAITSIPVRGIDEQIDLTLDHSDDVLQNRS